MKNIAFLFCLFGFAKVWAGKPMTWEVLASTANGSTFSHTLQEIDPLDINGETWVGDTIYSMHTDGTLRMWRISTVPGGGLADPKLTGTGNTSHTGGIPLFAKVVTVPPGGRLPSLLNLEPEFAALLTRYFHARTPKVPVLPTEIKAEGDEGAVLKNRSGVATWEQEENTVLVGATISGNGSSTPLDIAQQGATAGQVLKWSGTAWQPAADTGLELWQTREHLTECPTQDVGIWSMSTISGSGLTVGVASSDYEVDRPCIVAFTSAATTSLSIGSLSYGHGNQAIWMGAGSKFRTGFKLPTYPAISTDSLVFRAGFFPRSSGTALNAKGAYFDYRWVHSASEMRLYAVTSTGSTTTSTLITGQTMQNAWNEFEVRYSNATTVQFVIGSTVVATHTTNLPNMSDGSTRTFPGVAWGKFQGTAATYKMVIDYAYWRR